MRERAVEIEHTSHQEGAREGGALTGQSWGGGAGSRRRRVGAKPVIQLPRACSRQQVPELPLKKKKKPICIANELPRATSPSILGGKKSL